MTTAQLLFENEKTAFFIKQTETLAETELIKVVKQKQPSVAESLHFENEYEVTNALEIEGIRRAKKKITYNGNKAIVFSFFPGENLYQAFIGTRQPLDRFFSVSILITEVLGKIHKHGIIHRNITPRNILVDANFQKVCIIDFSLSSRFNLKMPYQGHPYKLEGNLYYMSPEQTGRMNRTVNHQSDLYSLGITFYEMLTGQLPFQSQDPVEMVYQHIAQYPEAPHQKNKEIPEVLSKIVMKLLAKSAEDRYYSSEGLRADLLKCQQQWEQNEFITAFELGLEDFNTTFQLPQKLYGRRKELKKVMAAFKRTKEGQSELLLVSGSAGVGKSALIHEIHRPITQEKGYFIEGKFDQYQRNIPYSAIIQALNSWVNILLSESDEVLIDWKEHILEKVGTLGQVLIQILPKLELIIGPQEPVPDLGPSESQNRFNYICRRFILAIADSRHPLVIFIDDLQWADGASLELIRNIISDPNIQYFLLIGAYRNDEVQPTHPFRLLLKDLNDLQIRPRNLELKNLKIKQIKELVKDAFSVSSKELDGLSEELMNRTEGNAFFALEYLKNLYRQERLQFNFATRRWEWKPGGANLQNGQRGIVGLISQKLQELPGDTLEVLKLAACMGNRFDLRGLSVISERPSQQAALLLGPAIENGLVSPVDNNFRLVETGLESAKDVNVEYVFIHDRVQQAVYHEIPEQNRQEFHQNIGELLLENRVESKTDTSIFDIVNHLNEAKTLLKDADQKFRLAKLNWQAGIKARQSAAYSPALNYLETGIELLPEDAWAVHYDLSLSIYTEATICAFLSGSLEQMNEHAQIVLEKAEKILDKVQVYNTLVDAYTAQNRLGDAVNIGLEALKGLGVRFPKKPKTIHVIWQLLRTKLGLIGKNVPKLAFHPPMEDPYKLEAMPLLERMVPPAYMSGSMLFPLLVFKMVNLSFRYGNSPLSPFAYASFAITLSGVLGDIKSGEMFGKLSLDTLDQLEVEEYKTKVYFVNFTFIRHWIEHLRNCIPSLLEAYQSGLKVGNLVGATWAAFFSFSWKYYCGTPLGELEQDLSTYGAIFNQLKQNAAYRRTDMLRQVTLNLMGHSSDPILFSGEAYADEEIKSLSSKGDDEASLFFYHFNKLLLNYLYGEYREGLLHSEEATSHLEAVTGLPDVPYFFFYDALNRIALSEQTNGRERKSLLKIARARQKKMKSWSQHAPMNYGHKFQLIKAEYLRVTGRGIAAVDYYHKAADGARTQGFLQEEAIARELYGRFYFHQNKKDLAGFYLRQSIDLYFQWGAFIKVEILEKEFAELFQKERTSSVGKGSPKKLETEALVAESMNLDVESAIKVGAAFSGEIVLEKLQAKLLEIVVENVGARSGALLLSDKSQLKLVAHKSYDEEEVELLSNLPLHGCEILPEPIINYVSRTKEPLIINEAYLDSRFDRDPYINRQRPKSILCIPILHKGTLQGMFYLENELVANAFKEERIRMLKVLSSQISISIENATLYKNLSDALDKQLVLADAYSRFTPRTFLKFLNKESILDVKLGDQRHGNMAILFSDIRSYTTLSETMTPEDNFAFINEYLKYMSPCVSDNEGVVNQFLGDGIMAFFPGAEQAVKASLAMLQELNHFNEMLETRGRKPIRIGVGLHIGPLMVGVIGNETRMDTAIVSDTVNTASRMEGLTKYYYTDLIVSEPILKGIKKPDRYHYRFLGKVRVKGKLSAIGIYDFFDQNPPEIFERKKTSKPFLEHGLEAYFRKDFDQAIQDFQEALKIFPQDKVLRRYLEQTQELITKDLPEDWQGEEIIDRK